MQGRWIFSLHDTCEMILGVEVQVQEDCWVFFLHDACEMRLNVQVQVQDSEPNSLMVACVTVWAEYMHIIRQLDDFMRCGVAPQ